MINRILVFWFVVWIFVKIWFGVGEVKISFKIVVFNILLLINLVCVGLWLFLLLDINLICLFELLWVIMWEFLIWWIRFL